MRDPLSTDVLGRPDEGSRFPASPPSRVFHYDVAVLIVLLVCGQTFPLEATLTGPYLQSASRESTGEGQRSTWGARHVKRACYLAGRARNVKRGEDVVVVVLQ